MNIVAKDIKSALKKYALVFTAFAVLTGAVAFAFTGVPAAADYGSAAYAIPAPSSPGTAVSEKNGSVIDYSNASSGYFTMKFTGQTTALNMAVTSPLGRKYIYLPPVNPNPQTFVLSDGSGAYSVILYARKPNGAYSMANSVTINANIGDSLQPFLVPNYYVNFNAESAIVKQAAFICNGQVDELKKVEAVYNWFIKNIKYDKQLASTVQSGYTPNLETLMTKKSGICFDYASGMTAMLRSQGVPTRMIFGYAGEAYHAWISVYVQGKGWVDNVIYFDGTNWVRMDPTFAATSNNSATFKKYVGSGSNYRDMYQY